MAIWRRIRVFLGFLLASALLAWVVFAVAEGIDELIEDSRAVAQSQRVL